MPNFKHAPFCRRSVLALVEPHTMAGNTVSSWLATLEDGTHFETIADVDLRKNARAIQRQDNGTGVYAVATSETPQRFQIDYKDQMVHFENDEPVGLTEFVRSAVRTDADGKILCAFIEPFHEQYQVLTEAGASASMHRYDLQELVESVRNEGFSSAAGMYDIVSSGLEDEVPFMDRLQNMSAASWSEDAVASLGDVGLPEQLWHEIKDVPQYGIDQVRAIFRALMGPYIGEFPLERVKRIHLPPGAPIGDAFGAAGTLKAINEPFNAGNLIRGYSTSQVQHFELPGVEAVVFSDQHGTYAYAWPVAPTLNAEPSRGMQP